MDWLSWLWGFLFASSLNSNKSEEKSDWDPSPETVSTIIKFVFLGIVVLMIVFFIPTLKTMLDNMGH